MNEKLMTTGVLVNRSLVLYVCFVDRCLSFCTFFFVRCVVLFFDLRILITIKVLVHDRVTSTF